MRSAVAFLALLLLAALATAQVTVSDEVVSDPLQIHIAPLSLGAPAVSLAKDRLGVAVAWSMGAGPSSSELLERVFVARLDRAGHVAGTVRQMPLASAAPAHAAYPSIAPAPGGDGFLIAWIEIDRDMPMVKHAAFSRLDAALAPTAPATLGALSADAPPAPIVRTKGGTTWIAAGGLWTVAQGGTVTGPIGGVFAQDMTVATDVPQYVAGHAVRSAGYTCKQETGCVQGPFPGIQFCLESCKIYSYTYALDFTALLTTSQSRSFNFNSDAQPAIGSNGSDVLVAWFSGEQSRGGDVAAVRLAPSDFARFSDAASRPTVLALFPPDAGETRPAIASDGQRYVVVWRSRTAPGNHDIAGAAIDDDGKVTTLTITTSSSDERDPAVLDLGGGTFLVAYEKLTGAERRIAGRFVTFGASGRRRPAR